MKPVNLGGSIGSASAVEGPRFTGAPSCPDLGVACESCHGAAELWLRFHTRPDVNHEQRVVAALQQLEAALDHLPKP